MKRNILTLLLAAILPFALHAAENENGIQFFNGTWSEALAKAKKENKLIFMDAYTTWCGPCKYMAKNIFTNDSVGEFFNRNFICVKMDMEKGEGIELAKTYGVQAYPTLLYVNGQGEMVHRTCGTSRGPDAAQQLISAGRDALDPGKQMLASKKKFESGRNDPAAAFAYLQLLAEACMKNESETKSYLEKVPEKELTSPGNWKVLYYFATDAGSREFKYLLDNKDQFYKLYTEDSVNGKIIHVYESSLNKCIKSSKQEEFDALKTDLKKIGLEKGEKVILNADMKMYLKKGDRGNYAKTAAVYVEKYAMDDSGTLNSIAWNFYEKVDDEQMLEKALAWSKRSVEMDNSYANNDTYAAILYKLGKKEEALKAAEKAIEIAKKDNDSYKETEELLEKIRKMK